MTASVGEPQLEANRASVARQDGVSLVHEVIAGLGKREAHRRIVELARGAVGKFDWVAKLDGDMVLRRDDALRLVVERAASAASIERCSTPVLDSYSGRPIMGFHVFRPIEQDVGDVEELHTDRWLTGLRSTTIYFREPIVLHAPDPDVEQSVRYGLQRGKKARAEGPSSSHWWVMAGAARLLRGGDETARNVLAAFTLGVGDDSPPIEALDAETGEAIRVSRLLDDRSDVIARTAPLVRRGGIWRLHLSTYGSHVATARTALRAVATTATLFVRARRARRR